MTGSRGLLCYVWNKGTQQGSFWGGGSSGAEEDGRRKTVSNGSSLTRALCLSPLLPAHSPGQLSESLPHPPPLQALATFPLWLLHSRKSPLKIDGFITCPKSLCRCRLVMNHKCHIARLPPNRTRRTPLSVGGQWNYSCWPDTGPVAMRSGRQGPAAVNRDYFKVSVLSALPAFSLALI